MTEQDKETSKDKDIEFYSASVNAWFASALEHDKSLLTLSAGGIGLLITLMTTIGIHSKESLILYTLSLISFVTCLFSILYIFRKNKKYLERILKKETPFDLSFLDTIAMSSFVLGVLFAGVIGVSSATHSFIHEEKKMKIDKTIPKKEVWKSFNGAENLRDGHEKNQNESQNSSQGENKDNSPKESEK